MNNSKKIKKDVNNAPLNILFVSNKNTDKKIFENLFKEAKVYLNISWTFLDVEVKSNFDFNSYQSLDVMFIDFQEGYEKIFNWELYDFYHRVNKGYLQVMVLEEFSSEDFWALKIGSDDVIYKKDGYEFLKWKLISIFRRMWDSHSKKTTIIHKGLIIDNNKKKFMLNEEDIHLTKKEFQLMLLLMSNIGVGFITKRRIFKLLWNDSGEDCTRVVDQIIFKIKKKVGKEIFEINKNGIKII